MMQSSIVLNKRIVEQRTALHSSALHSKAT